MPVIRPRRQQDVVDVAAATSWADFVAAFNDGFISLIGGEWTGNLDAFHDYLSWPDEQPYRLIVRGWHSISATVNQHMAPDHRPVLEVVAETLRDTPQAEVILD